MISCVSFLQWKFQDTLSRRGFGFCMFKCSSCYCLTPCTYAFNMSVGDGAKQACIQFYRIGSASFLDSFFFLFTYFSWFFSGIVIYSVCVLEMSDTLYGRVWAVFAVIRWSWKAWVFILLKQVILLYLLLISFTSLSMENRVPSLVPPSVFGMLSHQSTVWQLLIFSIVLRVKVCGQFKQWSGWWTLADQAGN